MRCLLVLCSAIACVAIAQPRFQTMLMSTFAAIALLLTLVGLYGALAYSVTRRHREIGVRIALGATPAGVLGLVVRQAMRLVASGLLLGLAGAAMGARLVRALIYGVDPSALPHLLAIGCAGIAVTGMLAACLPATRAASVEPMEALRSE